MKPSKYGKTISADKYYDIVNALSGHAHDLIVEALVWIFDGDELTEQQHRQKMKLLFKLVLGCDDPRPVLRELWKYKLWKKDPLQCLVFQEFAFAYIPASISLNFQLEDSDLSRKALMVGNIEKEKKSWGDLFR